MKRFASELAQNHGHGEGFKWAYYAWPMVVIMVAIACWSGYVAFHAYPKPAEPAVRRRAQIVFAAAIIVGVYAFSFAVWAQTQ